MLPPNSPPLHRQLLLADELGTWLPQDRWLSSLKFCVLSILLGFGIYGFTVGVWRSPTMGGFVAVKLPLLIFFTLGLNALLNTILGLLMGSGLGLKETVLCQLMSFSVAALVLGALSPITLLMALDAPTPDDPGAGTAHSLQLVIHTALIGSAGLLANRHLFRLLRTLAPSEAIARRTLITWVTGNAFLGAQMSWILRPFFGSPSLEVAFLRDDPMRGTFYEAVWRSLTQIIPAPFAVFLLITGALIGAALLRNTFLSRPSQIQTKHTTRHA